MDEFREICGKIWKRRIVYVKSFTREKKIRKRSFRRYKFRRIPYQTPALSQKEEEKEKIPISETISRTVQVAVSRYDTIPATCPTSVLAGTTALGLARSRVSFNEFSAVPPSLPPRPSRIRPRWQT